MSCQRLLFQSRGFYLTPSRISQDFLWNTLNHLEGEISWVRRKWFRNTLILAGGKFFMFFITTTYHRGLRVAGRTAWPGCTFPPVFSQSVSGLASSGTFSHLLCSSSSLKRVFTTARQRVFYPCLQKLHYFFKRFNGVVYHKVYTSQFTECHLICSLTFWKPLNR